MRWGILLMAVVGCSRAPLGSGGGALTVAPCPAEPGMDRAMVLDAGGKPSAITDDGTQTTWSYPACDVVFEGAVVRAVHVP